MTEQEIDTEFELTDEWVFYIILGAAIVFAIGSVVALIWYNSHISS